VAESHHHSADEYLMTIYLLENPVGEYLPSKQGNATAAVRIADQLGVSRASAGEMLKRLEAEGLITRGDKKEALLTPAGTAEAEKVCRRHRIVERLLTDVMGYTPAESHEKCDGLDDGFDDEMVERLWERLGKPERCPHGWPVDPEVERAENASLAAVEALDAGTKAEVVRLAEHDGELLHWYYDSGLAPGTKVEVVATGGATLKAGNATLTLNPVQAQGLFVKRVS
jgi:DtxR family Mn-dependent transcriptional regulator